MTDTTVRSPIGVGRRPWQERFGVLAAAGLIVTAIGAYLALNAVSSGETRGLLPYQTLARTLAESDQRQFRSLREALLPLETRRAQTSSWPEPATLAAEGVSPFSDSGPSETTYHWERFQQGATVNYLGRPADSSRPAWLLSIQEPEPGALPDPAPNDDEHHRLPDGTTLHIYVWMHRYGGQVAAGFVPQPQNSGWIGVFSAPPNPVASSRSKRV